MKLETKDSTLELRKKQAAELARYDIPVPCMGRRGRQGTVRRSDPLRSTRNHGAFEVVNCGAIPNELIDSELFGVVKGAHRSNGQS